MQCDWVSGLLAPGELYPVGLRLYDTGRVLAVDPDGSVEWQRSGRVLVEGSHDSRLYASSPDGASLYLSGNPVKFLQGHNLFGSLDHAGLWLAAGQHVRQSVGLFPGPETWAANGYKPPRWTRLDLTRSYRFSDDSMARSWLRDVGAVARSRHGAPVLRGTTVYWGNRSRRWELKAYLKSDELDARKRGHQLPDSLPELARRELREWACGVVRFELTLKALELEKIGAIVDPAAVWQSYFERVTWNRNAEAVEGVDMVDENALPNHLAGYLARWRAGRDLRQSLARNTFYRTRRALLETCGVDIAEPPPKREPVPEVRPVGLPTVLGPDAPGWDPEPLEAYLVEPDPHGELKSRYGLL